jgi:hypothetical protein
MEKVAIRLLTLTEKSQALKSEMLDTLFKHLGRVSKISK